MSNLDMTKVISTALDRADKEAIEARRYWHMTPNEYVVRLRDGEIVMPGDGKAYWCGRQVIVAQPIPFSGFELSGTITAYHKIGSTRKQRRLRAQQARRDRRA